MAYVDFYVLAVKTAEKDTYQRLAEEVWPRFRAAGATGMEEFWGDDVPECELTSFSMAVKREPDETVVVGWVAWPDRAARDRGNAEMEAEMAGDWNDPERVPVDGRRMIWGGFAPYIRCTAAD